MPDVTPSDCAGQKLRLKTYLEHGHQKVEFEPQHDTHRCPICLLCLRHCIEHYQVLEGLRREMRALSYVELKRIDEALRTPIAPLDVAVTVRRNVA